MLFAVAFGAQPFHIERFRIVVVMSLRLASAAMRAWLFLETPGPERDCNSLSRQIFLWEFLALVFSSNLCGALSGFGFPIGSNPGGDLFHVLAVLRSVIAVSLISIARPVLAPTLALAMPLALWRAIFASAVARDERRAANGARH